VGQLGVERQYEPWLRGRRGLVVDTIRRDGQLVSSERRREPGAGRDLVLSLDLALQRSAEALLDRACERRDALAGGEPQAAGGAIVVLDVHSGAILASTSAPRFDPNLFSRSPAAAASTQRGELSALLADPRHPLFDRASRMAIPPGSIFKTVTATAMLESGGFDPGIRLNCRGYLKTPDRERCAIYTRSGQGHGDVSLSDAICQSCNVYFFQHASTLGPQPIVDWAGRFGFGQRTGVDLPGEAAGQVPQPTANRQQPWRPGDTMALAIGQSSLTATPLQAARMMAAVANGGWLVTPHVVQGLGVAATPEGDLLELGGGPEQQSADIEIAPPRRIEGLHAATLEPLRRALARVVADPQGTARGTVYLETVAIAAKTGTAEAGGGQADHAWVAGYAPADAPKIAFVIALEHAGGGASSAGPVARRLVDRMQQLGYFGREQ
jgi:penicillin-binding protein 2